MARVALILSYVFDWIVLVVFAVVGAILGNISPNKRPFSLEDPDISFPYTLKETIPTWLLVVVAVIIPVVFILLVSLIFVPGPTVPSGTPKALIWRRKLWELHAGWLGLALSCVAAWFITSAWKNLCGKPRPDLLARCAPDIANFSNYVVGGYFNSQATGQLVSADICKNTDKSVLDDGFRSFPSGHSSMSAAGLMYLSLFFCSKFAITIPYLALDGGNTYSDAAFPSRERRLMSVPGTEPRKERQGSNASPNEGLSESINNKTLRAARRQAAAPPVYLLVVALAPFLAAIFISSSRWFDFRHHGFDILFGFFIGSLTSIFAFRFYHLSIMHGAGWAWGPRSNTKAWWAGIGSSSYATEKVKVDSGPNGVEV